MSLRLTSYSLDDFFFLQKFVAFSRYWCHKKSGHFNVRTSDQWSKLL